MERTAPQPGERIIPVDSATDPSAAPPAVEAVLNPVDPDIWLVTDASGRAYLVREDAGAAVSAARVWAEVLFKEDTAIY
jgi:hypothetical protein